MTEQILRIVTVTPSNFGSSGGTAGVDRPLALDIWRRLPFIPDASIKGVIAGRDGDVLLDGDQLNTNRSNKFGSPDQSGPGQFIPGAASRVTFGDGDLMAFPISLNNGSVATVVCADAVERVERLFSSVRPPIPRERYAGTVASDDIPGCPQQEHSLIPTKTLFRLIGEQPERVIVAGIELAQALWRQAVEIRYATAVERQTAVSGSLRSEEWAPGGCVFVSLVNNPDGISLPLGRRIQLGAAESIGAGFVRLDLIDVKSVRDTLHELERWPAGGRAGPRAGRISRDAYARVVEFARVEEVERGGPDVRANVRTIIRELGTRIRRQGVRAGLAFSMGRAGLSRTRKLGADARAHRWVLAAICDCGASDDLEAAAKEWIVGPERDVEPLLERCSWLARYAEILLPEPDEVEQKEVTE